MHVISNNDMDPLVTGLTVLTSSSLFLVVTVTEIAADEVSGSIVRSVPCSKLSVGNLPELERLGAAFEGDEFLSQGVVSPLGEEDCPEVVVEGTREDAVELSLATGFLD